MLLSKLKNKMGIEFNLYHPITKEEFIAIDKQLNERTAFQHLIGSLRKSIVICADNIYYFDELHRVFKKFRLGANGNMMHTPDLLTDVLQIIIGKSLELAEHEGYSLLNYHEEAEDSNGFIISMLELKLWKPVRAYWRDLTVQCAEFDTCHKHIHFTNGYYNLTPTLDRDPSQPWCTDDVPFLFRQRVMPSPDIADTLVSIYHHQAFEPNEEVYNGVLDLFKSAIPNPDTLAWVMNYIYYALIGETRQQVLNFVGPGGCGKSTFVELISLAFPREFICPLPQDCLTSPEKCQRAFGNIPSYARLYIADEPSDPKDQDAVKLIANGKMSCKVLYQTGSREVKLNGRLIAMSNRPIQWKDDDTGIERRYFTVDFTKRLVGVAIKPDEIIRQYGHGTVASTILLIIMRLASTIDSADTNASLPVGIRTGSDVLSVNGFMNKFSYVPKKTLKLDVMLDMAREHFSPIYPFEMQQLKLALKGVYSIKKNVVQDIGIKPQVSCPSDDL